MVVYQLEPPQIFNYVRHLLHNVTASVMIKAISYWKSDSVYKTVSGEVIDEYLPDILSGIRLLPALCPNGCSLAVCESDTPYHWARVGACYRQTRFCRTHGFAFIIVVSDYALVANAIANLDHPKLRP